MVLLLILASQLWMTVSWQLHSELFFDNYVLCAPYRFFVSITAHRSGQLPSVGGKNRNPLFLSFIMKFILKKKQLGSKYCTEVGEYSDYSNQYSSEPVSVQLYPR